MKQYTVLKPFEGHAKGDTVSLNTRQATFLELGGFIGPVKKKATRKASAQS